MHYVIKLREILIYFFILFQSLFTSICINQFLHLFYTVLHLSSSICTHLYSSVYFYFQLLFIFSYFVYYFQIYYIQFQTLLDPYLLSLFLFSYLILFHTSIGTLSAKSHYIQISSLKLLKQSETVQAESTCKKRIE